MNNMFSPESFCLNYHKDKLLVGWLEEPEQCSGALRQHVTPGYMISCEPRTPCDELVSVIQ